MSMKVVLLGRRKCPGLFLAGILVLQTLALHAQTDPPSITAQPVSLTNRAGTYPTFTVQAAGTEPLAFQWFKDGEPLSGSGYSGYLTNALTVNYARKTNEGSYCVVITNSYGSITSSNATLTVQDPAIAGPPINQNLPPGGSFSVSAAGTPPYSYQWQYYGAAISGATNTSLPINAPFTISVTNPGLYQCVVSNTYGSVTSAPAMLSVNATTLDPLVAGAANGTVYATAIQGDGGIVVGGAFTAVGSYARSRLARLLPNGNLDTRFNPNLNGDVYCVLAQTDGKLMVGGAFTTVGGASRPYLARLFEDGSLDTNFNASVTAAIYCLAWDRNGDVLAGGVNRLLRFSEAGVIDTTFNPTVGGTIYAVVDQPYTPVAGTGIIVGGKFASIAGAGRQNLARLWSDGKLDTLFNTPVSGQVQALALQRGGGVLLGGQFTAVGNFSRLNLARIDLSGRVDEAFNPGATTSSIYSIVTQADGKVLLGGAFSYLAGVPRSGLGRLNADGSLDPTFNPSPGTVYALALQADGKLIVGGSFTSLAGVSCTRLGRLNTTGPVAQQLTATPTTVQWLRSGALPEVDQVVFEQFVPGSGWMKVGDGDRIAGGWQAAGTVPAGATWRARGKAVGGYGSGSGSIIEWVTGPIVILTPPVGQTVSGTGTLPMSVAACGSGPLSYQWFRNGVAVTGETNATYNTSSLSALYQVVICNEFGCVQSDVVYNWRVGTVDSAARPILDSAVYALALQTDGKMLIGGSFSNAYFSSSGNVPRNHLLRLNADGSLDEAFNPDVGGNVLSLAVMPDGKIMLGGDFLSVSGQPRVCLARLNPDGTLDESFIANLSGPYPVGVYALVPQPDGKLLVGGSFSTVAGQTRSCVARLEASGAVDGGFVPPANLHPNRQVGTILPLSNSRILLGGNLMVNPGFYQNYLWVTQSGSLASSGYTTPILLSGYGVTAALEQLDGKIILGGFGFQVDPQPSRTLARLNSNGSPDASFPAFADGPVLCLAAQADGRILVGGAFTKLNGTTRSCLGRLYPDGSLDPTFNPGITGTNGPGLQTIALQVDGKVVLGGRFTNVVTSTRYNFARLPVMGSVSESWNFDGTSLTWLRDGLSPELQSATLESSPDGSAWQTVLAGDRVPGGWQLTGVTLPSGQHLRVRGQVSQSGSHTSQTETLLDPPVIKSQPMSVTNALGSIVGFYVGLQGAGPFGCQWYHDGVPLENGGRIAGANGSMLSVQVQGIDAGDYWVTVTNLFGSVTSSNATLTALDLSTPPSILTDEPAFGVYTNHFTFRINAIRGQTCVVEYSFNLRNWSPLATNTVTTSNPVTFVDPTVTTFQRFYRVRLR